MNEEKKMILEKLRDGKISVEEAEKLLQIPEKNPPKPVARSKPESVHVRITQDDKIVEDIRIPFSLAKIWLKFGKNAVSLARKYGIDEETVKLLETIDVDELVAAMNMGDISLPYTVITATTEKGEQIAAVIE